MIIPLKKLLAQTDNRFEFTKAAMVAVSRLEKIRDYPESDHNWKIVPNILKLVLEEKVHFYRK